MDFNTDWLKPDYLILRATLVLTFLSFFKKSDGEGSPQQLLKVSVTANERFHCASAKYTFSHILCPADVKKSIGKYCVSKCYSHHKFIRGKKEFEFCIQSVADIVSPLPFKFRRIELNCIQAFGSNFRIKVEILI